MALVTAVWAGPFDAEIPGRGLVRIGETHQIDDGELASSHWQAVTAAVPAAPVAPAVSAFASTSPAAAGSTEATA